MSITEHEPGTLCQRAPTEEELFELRELCIESKRNLEGVYSMLATYNMQESFNNVDVPIDDIGTWLDTIKVYCTRACKRNKKMKVWIESAPAPGSG